MHSANQPPLPVPPGRRAEGRRFRPAHRQSPGTGTPTATRPGVASDSRHQVVCLRPRPGNAPGTHGNCRRGNCRARPRPPGSAHPTGCCRWIPTSGVRRLAVQAYKRSRIQGTRTGNHACDSLTIVGCIGHRAGLYCRAFLASRLHHLLFLAARLGKVASADRCTSLKPPLLNVPL